MAANEVLLVVKGKDETAAAFDSAKKNAGGLKSALADVGKTAAGFLGAQAITSGINLFRSQIGSVFSEARESIEIGKQTAAVIKSTGGAAGVSAKEVAQYAESLSRVTNFDDEAIQSAENLLLTFTSIGKEVFPQATETVLDMSQALGQDLKSSAIQLGKAMNDPITGATALRRVGVALTEQQMDQIKAFQESGDILSAQKIIMAELAKEFGGSARATADPLKILGNAVANLKEQIGLAFLPVLMLAANALTKHVVPALQAGIEHFGTFIQTIRAALSGDVLTAASLFNELPAPLQKLALWLAKNEDGIRSFVRGLQETAQGIGKMIIEFAKWTKESGLLATAAEGVTTIVDALSAGLPMLADFLKDNKLAVAALGIVLGALLIYLLPIPAAILAVVLAVGFLKRNWDEIKAKTEQIWNAIPGPIKETIEWLVDYVRVQFEIVKNRIETALLLIRDIINIATALWRGDWSEAWDAFRDLLGHAWDGIKTEIDLQVEAMKQRLSGAWEGVKLLATTLGDALVAAVSEPLGKLRDVFTVAFAAIAGVVSGTWESLKTTAVSALNWIIDKVNALIGKINDVGGSLSKIGVDLPDVPKIPSVAPPFRPSGGDSGAAVNFGFATGTPYVPFDMVAQIHRGERIIPASQNRPGAMGNTYNMDAHIVIEGNASPGVEERIRRVMREEWESMMALAQFGGMSVNTAPFAP